MPAKSDGKSPAASRRIGRRASSDAKKCSTAAYSVATHVPANRITALYHGKPKSAVIKTEIGRPMITNGCQP